MRTGEYTALKVVAIMGALVLVLLFVLGQFYQVTLRNVSRRRPAAAGPSRFDGLRAYADLERIVAMGPRPSGSAALAELRKFIKGELEAAGLGVWEHAFEAETPVGARAMVNVVGVVNGTEPGVIVLGNHYETKYFPDFRFVGANDGGSTTAWMLEMARAIGPKREGRSLWLCFFDGEEAFQQWSSTDSLYGSRAFVRHLEQTNRLEDVKAMINVDMIGDRYLGIKRDADAPEWLNQVIWRNAQRLGYGDYFLRTSHSVEDDHVACREAGIPATDIIDFCYGPTRADHEQNWHTPNDTIERVCAESLQAVGDVIYHSLSDCDVHLTRIAQK